MRDESQALDWLNIGGWSLPMTGERMIERARLEPSCAYRWCIRDVMQGTHHAFNEHARCPASSTRKLYILVTVLLLIERGELALEDTLFVEKDRAGAQTCGGLWLLDTPRKFSIAELLKLMMGLSDNIAAFYLVELIGLERLNALSTTLGLCRTQHVSSVPIHDLTLDHPLDVVNTTTAWDLMTALSLLVDGANGRLPFSSPFIRRDLCLFGLDSMRAQQDTTAVRSWMTDVGHIGDKQGIGYRNYNNIGYLVRDGAVRMIFSFIVDDLHRIAEPRPAFAHARDFIALFFRLLDDCSKFEPPPKES
ncbi:MULTISPECIES: serine hydrolase [Pseudomonas]|uniref:serine hydrolase n=1 Tax=Pseudomonas TaxID=286 RepID=UPI001BE59341|nr:MULTISPECIES: serine hydrolase [Pseudomonas]MBT2340712.1 serine hydrolase [Pseudomonas fluorescens]MCD4528852.1 class A beta-lactamase-related serine hydrolase [Pseudomonas sp. C3-2018]